MSATAATDDILMPRHVAWRVAYRKDRYLQYSTAQEIKQRWEDLLLGHLCLTPDGKIGPNIERYKSFYGHRTTHILEELAIRGWPYPGPLAYPSSRGFIERLPHGPIGDRAWAKGIASGQLFRLSKLEHLKDALKHGSIRLCPASYYDNKSHNLAIRDNELSFDIVAKFQHIVTKQELGEIRHTLTDQSDFYMTCFCESFDLRLPFDFDANAILIIRDKAKFCARMARALKERFRDEFMTLGSSVVYLDPYLETADFKSLFRSNGSFRVWRAKHFRYMYQNEYRIVSMPKKAPIEQLGDPIIVNLGSLSDIAELHQIEW